MEVIALQVFVSLGLVVGSILLFAHACRTRTFDHADRLALLPLKADAGERESVSKVPSQPSGDIR